MSSDRLTILAVDDEQTQLEDLARILRASPAVQEVLQLEQVAFVFSTQSSLAAQLSVWTHS